MCLNTLIAPNASLYGNSKRSKVEILDSRITPHLKLLSLNKTLTLVYFNIKLFSTNHLKFWLGFDQQFTCNLYLTPILNSEHNITRNPIQILNGIHTVLIGLIEILCQSIIPSIRQHIVSNQLSNNDISI